jgi:hypothetical protein
MRKWILIAALLTSTPTLAQPLAQGEDICKTFRCDTPALAQPTQSDDAVCQANGGYIDKRPGYPRCMPRMTWVPPKPNCIDIDKSHQLCVTEKENSGE